METARCPDCGASVRAGAAWCSLCYRDLRLRAAPVQKLAAVIAPRKGGTSTPTAPPQTPGAPSGTGAHRRTTKANPPETASFESHPMPPFVALPALSGTGTDDSDDIVDAEIVDESGTDESSRDRSPARWPCVCGALVPMSQASCPTCGSEFLGDLSTADAGRHRTGGGLHWPRSRRSSLALAAGVALLFAVVLPLLLAVLG